MRLLNALALTTLVFSSIAASAQPTAPKLAGLTLLTLQKPTVVCKSEQGAALMNVSGDGALNTNASTIADVARKEDCWLLPAATQFAVLGFSHDFGMVQVLALADRKRALYLPLNGTPSATYLIAFRPSSEFVQAVNDDMDRIVKELAKTRR